jgi:hypothetical protein
MLKPGGLLITKTPCLGGNRYARSGRWWVDAAGRQGPAAALRLARRLEAAIAAAGFDILGTGRLPAAVPLRGGAAA